VRAYIYRHIHIYTHENISCRFLQLCDLLAGSTKFRTMVREGERVCVCLCACRVLVYIGTYPKDALSCAICLHAHLNRQVACVWEREGLYVSVCVCMCMYAYVYKYICMYMDHHILICMCVCMCVCI